MSASVSVRPRPSTKRSAGQSRAKPGDRGVRRLAGGEEPVADHRMAVRQPPAGRLRPRDDLAQPVGDAPVRRQPGQRLGMRRSQCRMAAGTGSSACRSNGQA